MISETYQTWQEMLKQIGKEKPAQFAVAEDDDGWVYSRPVQYMKEPTNQKGKENT